MFIYVSQSLRIDWEHPWGRQGRREAVSPDSAGGSKKKPKISGYVPFKKKSAYIDTIIISENVRNDTDSDSPESSGTASDANGMARPGCIRLPI